MKISELIAELEAIKAEKGDLPVWVNDSYGDHEEAEEVVWEERVYSAPERVKIV